MNRITPAARIAELVAEHGSYRAAGAAVGYSHSVLHRSATGSLRPTPAMLIAIGLDPTTATYEPLTSVRRADTKKRPRKSRD